MSKPNERWLRQDIADHAKEDFKAGLFLRDEIPGPVVSFMGSGRISLDHPLAVHCRSLAYSLGKKGYGILSGGGGGIMLAASLGGKDAGAPVIAIQNKLLSREFPEDESIFTKRISTEKLMLTRRALLLGLASALVFYPGGFGTENEESEQIMLVQNKLVDDTPRIYVEDSNGFWSALKRFREKQMASQGYIDPQDLDLMSHIETIESHDSITRITDQLQKSLSLQETV